MKELFKKYRPKVLKRVVGNTETVLALRSMLRKGTLPQTILFSGPSGCGKTTLARILAKELQCHTMDLVEMNCSSFRGIDTVRDVMSSMRLAPVGGPCRIWILDEIHQLSKDAQNAALKMLEDTPENVYFLLATTDPQKLLPTVRSRCSSMPVRHLTQDELGGLVRRVGRLEGIELPERTLDDLVDAAGGSARTALVLLDKIRNLEPEAQAEALKVRAEEEREAIDLCRALLNKKSLNWGAVTKILKNLKGEAESTRRVVLGYARSVLLGGKDHQAYVVICAFENHFYDSGDAGLARACFEACFGQ